MNFNIIKFMQRFFCWNSIYFFIISFFIISNKECSIISDKNVKETDEKDKEKEKQLSKTLLLVTFTFLTLTILQYIRHVLFSFWNWTQVKEKFH